MARQHESELQQIKRRLMELTTHLESIQRALSSVVSGMKQVLQLLERRKD